MNDEEGVYVKLLGVTPDDIPTGDDWDGESSDAAVDLSNDIHDLIRDEYPFDAHGVVAVVAPNPHKTLNESDPNEMDSDITQNWDDE